MATATQPQNPVRIAQLLEQAHMDAEWKLKDEARLSPAPRIRTNKKYLFRFRTGASPREFKVRIPHVPDVIDDERKERIFRKKFATNRARVDGLKPTFNLGQIIEEIGSEYLAFKSKKGNARQPTICYYDTDSENIANYLRYRMQTSGGLWQYLDEERPTEVIEVNGVSIPNTSEGWDAAKLAALSRTRTGAEE
jgi:hypothetical protein